MGKQRRLVVALLSTLLLATSAVQAATLSAQNGCIFVKGGAPTVYFVDAGMKRAVRDWDTYLRLGGASDRSNVCTSKYSGAHAVGQGTAAGYDAQPGRRGTPGGRAGAVRVSRAGIRRCVKWFVGGLARRHYAGYAVK